MHFSPDPTTEFLRKYTVQVSSNWISSLKVKLSLTHDKLVVGLLLRDTVSTHSVGGELSACAKTTMKTDVPAETLDISVTGVEDSLLPG